MGDGVLAYFGYPQAHEEDAERAVRAGLALIEAAAEADGGAVTVLRVQEVGTPQVLWSSASTSAA